jgi:AcrR family transcriptional regulator
MLVYDLNMFKTCIACVQKVVAMADSGPDPKTRILQATIDLLNEQADPVRMTVRQIAERAAVGIGLINYHFQSKDNLLNEAVSAIMLKEASRWFEAAADTSVDPVVRLKQLLMQTSGIGARYPQLLEVMVGYELQHGDFNVPLLIVPLLREIFGTAHTEMQIRMMALQIVLPLQVVSLRADLFRMYAGLDILNEQQRNQAIELMIDNIVNDSNLSQA